MTNISRISPVSRLIGRFIRARAMHSLRLPLVVLVGAVTLGGCHADVATGVADQAVYNATYLGAGTLQRSPAGYATAIAQPVAVSITLSTLASRFSGPITITPRLGATSYAGGVTGRLTPTGADVTYVQTGSCPGTLYGSFTLNADGTITGAAAGRDCDAGSSGDNVRLAFTNLVRQ